MEKIRVCKIQRTIEGEWDKDRYYEIFSDVMYKGDSYTSRRNVPKGIDITNSYYWSKTSSFSQQVANLQQEINDIINQVEEHNSNNLISFNEKLADTRINFNTKLNSLNNILLEKINSLLNGKLNKDEFNRVMSKLNSLTPKGVFNTLNDLINAFPNGNDNIYVVNNEWYFYNGSWNKGGTYNSAAIGQNSIEPFNCSFFENYEIPFTKLYGKVLQPTGEEQNNESFISTDFIKIDEGNYSINLDCKVHMYDSSKTWKRLVTINNNSFLIGSDISFIRFTYRSDLDNEEICLCEGTSPKTKTACTPVINPKHILASSYWKGKKLCFYGDSIVQQDKFTKYVNNKLQLNGYYNWGIGGTRYQSDSTYVNTKIIDGKLNILNNNVAYNFSISEGQLYQRSLCSSERIETIPTDIDGIVLFAATNDYGSNSTIKGSLSSYNDNFEGSIVDTIKKLKIKLPNIPIFICSPIFARSSTRLNTDKHEENSIGKTIYDYGKVLKEVCEQCSVNYIPVGEESGISFYNLEEYLEDGVHPNNIGNELIGKIIVKYLNMYKG